MPREPWLTDTAGDVEVEAGADEESPPEEGRAKRLVALAVPAILVIAIFAVTYPKAVSYADEAGYLGQAWTFRQGEVYPSSLGARIVADRPAPNGARISYFPPGMAAVLAPIATEGFWPIGFLVGLMSLLAIWLAAVSICRVLKIDDRWSWLWLFYPPFIFFSRTMMSDLPTAALTLVGFALVLRRRHFWAGVALAPLIFLRLPNVMIVGLFVGAALILDLKSREQFRRWRSVSMAIAPAAAGLLIAVYGWLVLGSPFALGTGYGSAGFSLDGAVGRFGFYILAMALVYPAMIAAPFLYRRWDPPEAGWYPGLVTVGMLLFYSLYQGLQTNPTAGQVAGLASYAARPIYGMRFMLPAAALLLVPYSAWLSHLFKRIHSRTRMALASVIVIGLLVATAGLSIVHSRYQATYAKTRAEVVTSLPAREVLLVTERGQRFASPVWGIDKSAVIGSDLSLGPISSESLSPAYLEIAPTLQEDQLSEGLRASKVYRPIAVQGGTLWVYRTECSLPSSDPTCGPIS